MVASDDQKTLRAERPRQLSLSGTQEDTWYVSRLAPDTWAFHEAVTLHRYGPLDETALRQAFAQLVSRHEAWRTTFPIVDGIAVQSISPSASPEVTVVDLSDEPTGSVEDTAAALVTETARRPYDLEREVPLRLLVVRFAADRYRIYLALHHLVFDALALVRVVIPELVALYEAFAAGLPSPLAPVRAQYGDYTAWEHDWLEGPAVSRRLAHWRRHLEGATTLDLPLDRPRQADVRLRGGALELQIGSESVGRIRKCARETRTSLFQVMAAGFAALLHTQTAQEDISFGTAVDMRRRADLEEVVGYCVALVPLRVDLSGDPTFQDLLYRTRDEILDAYDHAVPFSRFIRAVRPHRPVGLNPLMQAIIVQEPSADLPPGWDFEIASARLANDIGVATLDLQIVFEERPGGIIRGRAIFDADVLDAVTVRQLVDRWLRLLDDAVREPSKPVSELSIVSEPERSQLFAAPADPSTHQPTTGLVHALIAESAGKRPDSSAVVCRGETLTYRELMAGAQSVADRLRGLGVGVGDVVAIVANRTVATVAAILGILTCGAAYLPLDPDDPPERLGFMLADTRAAAVVTTRESEPAIAGAAIMGSPPRVYLDESDRAAPSRTSDPPSISPSDAAYVIYTSGSTGRPKGVRVSHAAVANLMTAVSQVPGISADDVLLSLAPFTFDVSVGDLFPTLWVGATAVLATRDEVRDPAALARLMETAGATIVQATPTSWQMLVDSGWVGSDRLAAWTAGEAISDELAASLRERAREVWNLYGPTETTVFASAARLSAGAPVTIGVPLANMRMYVVGPSGHAVPIGVVGEICIGGRGVADGYVNRDTETAERFVADPFVPGERMYRTGDRGRLLASGQLAILGRTDNQLKLRGVRVEPGEIESVLRTHPAVSAAVVALHEFGPGDQRLVAHVVGSGSAPLAAAELSAWMRTALPGRLVPSVVMPIGELPVTASGKADRRALPAPPMERPSETEAPPTSALERDLARLWADVLGITHVGRHDDFFDLGGHSLLAIQLLVEIEQLVGRPVPVSWLGEAGNSVAGLAQLIRDGGPSPTHLDREVGRVATSGSHARRLILIWPNPATMMAVRHLRTRFAADEPITSIVPDYSSAESLSFADVTDRAYQQIRDIQPAGPYAIGGFSLGGVVAYEVAGRLQAAGESVSFLAVIDASTPRLASRTERITARFRRFFGHGRDERRVQIRRMVSRMPRPWHGRWRIAPSQQPLSPEWPELIVARQLRAVGDSAGEYTLHGHDVPLDLYTSEGTVEYTRDRLLGWRRTHNGPIRLHGVVGDHETMWVPPNVERLADLLVDQFRLAVPPTGQLD